jgi:hypothetical protein
MKYRLWIHAQDKEKNTVEQGVIASGYYGNRRAAKDGLWPKAMALVQRADIQSVHYQIYKESSMKPVMSGTLNAVSIKPDEKSEVNDAEISE